MCSRLTAVGCPVPSAESEQLVILKLDTNPELPPYGVAWQQPETPNETAQLDAWLASWKRLYSEVQSADGRITQTLLARYLEARAIRSKMHDGPTLMDLTTDEGVQNFRHMRFGIWRGEGDVQNIRLASYDRGWLDSLRADATAWRNLGPEVDWSDKRVPNVSILQSSYINPNQSLDAFISAFKASKPSSKWTKWAAEIAGSDSGQYVRRALIDWLETLAVPGSASMRVKHWPSVVVYRTFRWKIGGEIARAGSPAKAALLAIFTYTAPGPSSTLRLWAAGTHDPAILSDEAVSLVRGAVALLSWWRDAEAVATLQRTAIACATKLSVGRGTPDCRSRKCASEIIRTLGSISTPDAFKALEGIRTSVTDRRLAKQISATLQGSP